MSAISKDALEDIQRLLECPICLERQKRPRQLPCIHSFCEECIQDFINKNGANGKINCPGCSRVTDVPENGAAGFSFNHFVNHLNDCVPETSNVVCYVCHHKGSTVGAESTCLECAHHLCKKCADMHCNTGLTLDHTVVNLDEVIAGLHVEAIRRHQKNFCPKHPGKVLEIFCEQCKEAVCLLCVPLDHAQHNMKNLEEAARSAIDTIQDLIGPGEDTFEHARVLSDECRKVLEELSEDKLASNVERIGKIYDDFKKKVGVVVEVKKNEAVTKLNVQFHSARKQAQVAFDEAESKKVSIRSSLDYAKKLITKAQASETVQQFPHMTTTLKSLDNVPLPTHVVQHVLKLIPTELPMPDLSVDPNFTEVTKDHVKTAWKLPKAQVGLSIDPDAVGVIDTCVKPKKDTKGATTKHKKSKTSSGQNKGLTSQSVVQGRVPRIGGRPLEADRVDTQKQFINTFIKSPLKKGDIWYLVDVMWFKQWKKYVGYDSWDMSNVGDQSAYPGPIDNTLLYAEGSTSVLAENLIDELDYVLLPTEAWNKLVTWYGIIPGQEPVARRVIEQGMSVKHYKVEVYLMELKLCENSDCETSHKRQFSRADTIEYLMQEMKRVFNISEDKEVRLWNKSCEQLNRLENTVQDSGLYLGQTIVIEQKNEDGTWPRQTQGRRNPAMLD